MDPSTLEMIRAAEEAVTRLIEACRKTSPLYLQNPRAVSHVSRTGKWFLNAIATLCREVHASASDEGEPKKGA